MADDLSGTTFAGRYQIVGLIGQGGMGVVYKAINLHLGEAVALKVLRNWGPL
jgi:serine/threonine protein kinase